MSNETIFCEECGEKLNPKKAKWLELSITDGQYYNNVPPMHQSQGLFAFGTACATKVLKRTTEFIKTRQAERLSKFTHIYINFESRGAERVIDRDVDYWTKQIEKQELGGRIMPFEVAYNAPDLLKENQELKARCQVHANMVGQLAEKLERKEALNAELLEALEEAVFMIQGYQVQHGEGPSNKKKLESLKSAINKAKAQ